MANIGVSIRASGYVKVKSEDIRISSFGITSTFTAPEYIYTPSTFRFLHNNIFDVFSSINQSAINSNTNTEDLFAANSFRFFQTSSGRPFINTFSSGFNFIQASGIYETLARPIVEVKQKSIKSSKQERLSGYTKYSFANQQPTDTYLDLSEPIQTIDTIKNIVWWGSANKNEYISIEYRKRNDDGIWDNTWRDLSESQSYISANGQDTVSTRFSWSSSADNDENQTVTYDLIIAYDFGLTNIFLYKENLSSVEYTVLGDEKLDSDQIYFWSVRSRDSVGDVSEWSDIKSIETFKNLPPNVIINNNTKMIIIPFKQYSFDWNIGNLSSGFYQYAIKRVDNLGNLIEYVIPRNGVGRYFIVDHTSSNAPIIKNISYDPQSYTLNFDLQIRDSKFRDYDIKNVYYADQKDKITGKDKTGFYLDSYNWRSIPFSELAGRKKQLSSNPYISKNAILGWAFNENKEKGKKYTFDLQIHSESNPFLNKVVWAYKTYDSITSTWSDWIKTDLDFEDPNYFTKPNGFVSSVRKNTTLPYYGKANPVGIIMNNTYLRADYQQNHSAWQFGLFDEFNNLKYQTTSNSPIVEIIPETFYNNDFTNIIIDLKNIEYEYYELWVHEIDKITSVIPNKDFFWRARTYDGYDYSSWSPVEKSNDFNTHHFEWIIKNDSNFKSTNFLVLKVEIELSEPVQRFEYPLFSWLSITNPQIDNYTYQIQTFEDKLNNMNDNIKPIYISYINYLKRKIIDVRNTVLDSLIENGYFENESDFQDFIDKNINSNPVFRIDGAYNSEVDIQVNNMETVKSIIDDPQKWSTALYNFKLDLKNRSIRKYDKVGMACENEKYSKCYLVTGDKNSCPWIGKHELGFCKGFVGEINVHGNTKTFYDLPAGINNPPDKDVDPEAYLNYLNENKGLDELQEIIEANDSEQGISLIFDAGNCPMAKGASSNNPSSPCIRYKDIDNNFAQKTCEICNEERYPQFISSYNELSSKLSSDIYSDINPAGFAFVDINSGESSSTPLVGKGQSLDPRSSFINFKLKRIQLPGQLNADYLDDSNENTIKNPFFKKELQEIKDLSDNFGEYLGGWFPIIKSETSFSEVAEII